MRTRPGAVLLACFVRRVDKLRAGAAAAEVVAIAAPCFFAGDSVRRLFSLGIDR
jgi:hypothetical protein